MSHNSFETIWGCLLQGNDEIPSGGLTSFKPVNRRIQGEIVMKIDWGVLIYSFINICENI